MVRTFTLFVTRELDGVRVETALRRGLGLSVTRIKRAKFRPDGILLDGARVCSDHIVHAGQRLEVHLPEREDSALAATPGEITVLFEDEWLMVVDKPAGLPTHPGPGHYDDTLGNRLVWRAQQRGEAPVLRPVNRLDKGTSGLLVLAKRAEAHERLQGLLHTDDFRREYLALAARPPRPDRGTVDAPIGPKEGALNCCCVREDGRPARTEYETAAVSNRAALLRLRLRTGRTHQIRVHMAHLGIPLLGDALYGGAPELDRPALHSWRLELRHPFTGVRHIFVSPMPEEFRAFGLEEPK